MYQAVYLDKLTAASLLQQLVLKLGWLSIDLVGSFVQLVPNLNVLVKVEDTLVQTIQDEDVFSVHTVKRKSSPFLLPFVLTSHVSSLPSSFSVFFSVSLIFVFFYYVFPLLFRVPVQ